MILYLAMCLISWRGAAIVAAVDAVQCACEDIMSSELIMHLSAKPRLKGKCCQKLKINSLIELGTLISMVYVSTSCDLPFLRYLQFKSRKGAAAATWSRL